MFHDFLSKCHDFLVSDATEHPQFNCSPFPAWGFSGGKRRRRIHGKGKVTEKGRWAEPWEGIRSRAWAKSVSAHRRKLTMAGIRLRVRCSGGWVLGGCRASDDGPQVRDVTPHGTDGVSALSQPFSVAAGSPAVLRQEAGITPGRRVKGLNHHFIGGVTPSSLGILTRDEGT